MKSSLVPLTDRPLRGCRKDSGSRGKGLLNLVSVAAVTAAFGLPVWIMVSTLGGQSSDEADRPAGMVTLDIPWQVVRSKDESKVAAPEMVPTKATPVMQAVIGKSEKATEVEASVRKPTLGSPKPVLTDVDKGIIVSVPDKGGDPVVVSH